MIYHKVFLFIYFIRIIAASLLQADEKLLRVRNAKADHGENFFIGLAQKFGYQAEQHYVTTTDGYILKIFRIPSSFHNKNDRKRVVLLEGGLITSSDSWAVLNRSLAYTLVDNGYDVWVGNYRGNVYGRSHQTLNPEEPLFWNYSWHEIGTIDYASTINYILELTNASTISFIVHSMGGTASFALLSDRPEYNDKINVLIAMAPAIYWQKNDIMRSATSNIACLIKDIVDPSGLSEILPLSSLPLNVIKKFCKKYNIMDFCFDLLSLFLRADPKELDKNDILMFFHFYPAGISGKSFGHYCQLFETGKFCHYDYGAKNLEYYGQADPPEYKLKNVKVRTVIIYSESDWISTGEDNQKIAKQVSGKVILEEIKVPKFTHLDFLISKHMKFLFHDKILNILSEYSKE